MGIKICGHIIRFEKPIKIYTLLKTTSLVLVLGAVWAIPASAADNTNSYKQASTCAAAPCPLLQKSDTATRTGVTPQQRAQRTAGTDTMSPALALAMALGYRNVPGPLERSRHVVVRDAPPVTKKQAALLSGDGGSYKRSSMNAAAVRLALED